MARRVSAERKAVGARVPKIITATMIRPPSIVIVGSLGKRPAKRVCQAPGNLGATLAGMTNTPLSLALRRIGSCAYAHQNHNAGDKSERVGRHAKQGQAILKNS